MDQPEPELGYLMARQFGQSWAHCILRKFPFSSRTFRATNYLGLSGMGLNFRPSPHAGQRDTVAAIFEAFDFLVELLPALRAGELSFLRLQVYR